MECKDVQSRLEAYLDGELPSAERRSVSSHLAYCPRCAQALEALSTLHDAGKRPYVPDPGEAYWKRLSGDIMRAVENASPQEILSSRPRWRGLQPSRLGMAALAVTAVLVILVVGKVSREDLGKGAFRVPVAESDAMQDKAPVLGGVAADEAEAPSIPLKEEASPEPAMERKPSNVTTSKSLPAVHGAEAKDADRMLVVDGVAAPQAAAPLRERAMTQGTFALEAASDSLALRIGLLERRATLASDSASAAAIRVRQARLHVRRVQAQGTNEARETARSFYGRHADIFKAHPDSAWFRINLTEFPAPEKKGE